jgi:hypothetical protein
VGGGGGLIRAKQGNCTSTLYRNTDLVVTPKSFCSCTILTRVLNIVIAKQPPRPTCACTFHVVCTSQNSLDPQTSKGINARSTRASSSFWPRTATNVLDTMAWNSVFVGFCCLLAAAAHAGKFKEFLKPTNLVVAAQACATACHAGGPGLIPGPG